MLSPIMNAGPNEASMLLPITEPTVALVLIALNTGSKAINAQYGEPPVLCAR